MIRKYHSTLQHPLDREELAWAAGLFDGEGSIIARPIVGRWKTHQLRLSIGQRDRQVLDRFYQAVGCLGNVRGPYKRKTGGPLYFYSPVGEAAQAVIAMIWQWLSPVKRTQATIAITAWKGR